MRTRYCAVQRLRVIGVPASANADELPFTVVS